MRWLVLLVAVGVAGCGSVVAPSDQPKSPMEEPAPDVPGLDALLPGGVDAEAADECGFPPGTPLLFAGRATTAGLGVQEVVGDPMSNDPADIYITRDEFDRGELRGRLVCAIYVDTPGFVEVTLVPDGWVPGGGRPPDPPAPEPTPFPERPSTGVARADAIEIAKAAAPHAAEWEVSYVLNGPAGEILFERESEPWAAIPDDRWLWRIDLSAGDRATTVFVDYETGDVYGSLDFIVN